MFIGRVCKMWAFNWVRLQNNYNSIVDTIIVINLFLIHIRINLLTIVNILNKNMFIVFTFTLSYEIIDISFGNILEITFRENIIDKNKREL